MAKDLESRFAEIGSRAGSILGKGATVAEKAARKGFLKAREIVNEKRENDKNSQKD